MDNDKNLLWTDDIKYFTDEELVEEISEYITDGGKLYIGADSMLFSQGCRFVCAVALHNPEKRIATYYYKKTISKSKAYQVLQNKILDEVALSIEIAQLIVLKYPDANIEVHVDVGHTHRSKTRMFLDMVRGWVLGSGFKFKHKPDSWASSSIADLYTK
jgi:hypothetical protein